MLGIRKLEDRVVLDGAAVVEVLEQQAAELTAEAAELIEELGAAAIAAGADDSRKSVDLVLVSNALEDYENLVGAAGDNATVLVYDAELDSVSDVMAQAIALIPQDQQIGSVSLFSHGAPGEFNLGNTTVNLSSFSEHDSVWQALNGAMTDDARLFLFGCNVLADSGQGQALIDELANKTGADIYASNDLSGQGGDWLLEGSSDQAPVAMPNVDLAMLADYPAALDPIVIENNNPINVNEGGFVVITNNELQTTDPESTPERLQYRLERAPVLGNIRVLRDGELETLNANDTFTQAEIDDGSVFYFHNGAEVPLSETFDFTVSNDLTSGGTGVFTIDINPVNDSPEIDLDTQQQGRGIRLEYTEGDEPLLLSNPAATGLSVYDADSSSLQQATIEIVNWKDGGFETLNLDMAEANGLLVQFNAERTQITITGVADLATYQSILSTVTYHNTDDDIDLTSRRVEFTVTDAEGATSVISTALITLEGVNDQPVFTSIPGNGFETLEDTPITVGGVSIGDADDPNGDRLDVQVILSVENGTLDLLDPGDLEIGGDGLPGGSITLTGTVNEINEALAGLQYQGNLNYVGPDKIKIVYNDLGNGGLDDDDGIDDSGGEFTEIEIDVNVLPVNDPPAWTVPEAQVTEEESPLTVTGLVLDDPDVNEDEDGELTVTIAIDTGVLTLAAVDGLVFSEGDGTDDAKMTFTGSLADINLAIASLDFTPDENFYGDATVTLFADDNGFTGQQPLTANDQFVITVTPVDDAPTIIVPEAQETEDETPLAIPAITIADVDAFDEPVQLTLAVENGRLTLGNTSGLTFTTGTGSDDAEIVLTGTITDINAALETLTYVGDPGFGGIDPLVVTVNDLGNTGDGGPLETTDIVEISVGGPPKIDLNGPDNPGEDSLVVFTENDDPVAVFPDVTVVDVDSPLLTGGQITLVNILDPGFETLDIVTEGTNIFADYDPETGIITLNGQDTAEAYQQVIASLTYLNTSDDPTTTDRMIEVTLTDEEQVSRTAHGIVEIIPVNDDPILVANDPILINDPFEVAPIDDNILNFEDPDNPPDEIIYTITSIPDFGELTFNGEPLLPGQTFTQQDINDGLVVYTAPEEGDNDTEYEFDDFTFTVTDAEGVPAPGGNENGEFVFNVDLHNLNLQQIIGDFRGGMDDPLGFVAPNAMDVPDRPVIDSVELQDLNTNDADHFQAALDQLDDMATRLEDYVEEPLLGYNLDPSQFDLSASQYSQGASAFGLGLGGALNGQLGINNAFANGAPSADADIQRACSVFEVLDLECRNNEALEQGERLQSAQSELLGRYSNANAYAASPNGAAEVGGADKLLFDPRPSDLNNDLGTAQPEQLGRNVAGGHQQAAAAQVESERLTAQQASASQAYPLPERQLGAAESLASAWNDVDATDEQLAAAQFNAKNS